MNDSMNKLRNRACKIAESHKSFLVSIDFKYNFTNIAKINQFLC